MITKTAPLFILLFLATPSLPARADDKWDIGKLDLSKLPPALDKQGVTYAKDIRPLLGTACFRCHGEERQKGDLRLDSLDGTLKGGKNGKVVLAGNSQKSLLVAAVAQIDNRIAMPPKGGPGGGGAGGNRPPGGGPPPDGPGGRDGGNFSDSHHGGPGGPGGPGGFGPPPRPLTAEQVGLIRAWIDQGAK